MVPVNLLQYLSQNLAASITAASRPALTFFAVQSSVFLSLRLEWLVVDSSVDWMMHPAAVAIGGVLAILELLAQHDDDLALLLQELKIQQFMSGLGAFSTALLYTALASADEQVGQLAQQTITSSAGLVDPTTIAAGKRLLSEQGALTARLDPSTLRIGTVGTAVGVNIGLGYVRAWLHDHLEGFELQSLWQKIETGGVLAALLVLLFAPALCLGLLLAVLLLGGVIGLFFRGVLHTQDQLARYNCPHCDHRIRKEALICFSCRHPLEAKTILAPKNTRG